MAKTLTFLKGLCIMKKTLGTLLLSSLFAASALAQTAPAKPAPAASAAVAAPGQVWVNGKVYHCPGPRDLAKPKTGKKIRERPAIAAGPTWARRNGWQS